MISISTNHKFDKLYEYLEIQLLHHDNNYIHESADKPKGSKNAWLNAYYPTNIEVCYLPGDIYWTEAAIKKIIETKTNDVVFFAAPGIQDGRKYKNIKSHREPLGFKVVNTIKFRQGINDLLKEIDEGKFKVDPVSWTLYKKLNNLEYSYNGWNNDVFDKPGNLVVIDDMTTDIDSKKDIPLLESMLWKYNLLKGDVRMVRVKAKQYFTFNEEMFKQITELTRANAENNEIGEIWAGDTFLCNTHIAKYLLNEEDKEGNKGPNPADTVLVDVIEVIPEESSTKVEIPEEKAEDVPVKPKRKRKAKYE